MERAAGVGEASSRSGTSAGRGAARDRFLERSERKGADELRISRRVVGRGAQREDCGDDTCVLREREGQVERARHGASEEGLVECAIFERGAIAPGGAPAGRAQPLRLGKRGFASLGQGSTGAVEVADGAFGAGFGTAVVGASTREDQESGERADDRPRASRTGD